MIRLHGIIKVIFVIALDFFVLLGLFDNVFSAALITGVMAIYVWLGGYLVLFKEGAVSYNKLPSYESIRLHTAKDQLVEDVKLTSSTDISKLKLYLVPGNDDMNATAYGSNCVSVTRGTFDNTNADPIALNAILAHEISHILNFDPEFNRAVFCSVTLLVGAISVMSSVITVIIFLIFLLFRCFKSWLGVMAFKGTTTIISGIFNLLQYGIVVLYRTMLNLVSRHAEYRSDLYSCSLGYGLQLAHFLAIAAPSTQRKLTLTEIMYRTHPPTEKRIARLEEQLKNKTQIETK